MKTVFVFVILALKLSLSLAETVHWQWRDLVCDTKSGKGLDKLSKDPAKCSLFLRESDSPQAKDQKRQAPGTSDELCFDEKVNGTIRTYCNLLCPRADTVYLIRRSPPVHKSCFVFYTHKLERRGDDWYLWRDKNCRLSAIEFKIRCEFLFPRKDFPPDEQIFRTLRKRT